MSDQSETQKGLNEQIGEDLAQVLAANGGNIKITYAKEADPLPLHAETPINLAGVLDSSAAWAEARKTLIDPLASYVLVNRELLTVELVTEERSHFKNRVGGKLLFHPAFELFGINKTFFTTKKMADIIKMNRTFFESREVAMSLTATFNDFVAKVDKDVQQKQSQGGDYTILKQQAVSTNLPKAFTMVVPIFRGQSAQKFEVETEIDPSNLEVRLISPQANEETERMRDNAINKVLERIKEALPGIVVIEQ